MVTISREEEEDEEDEEEEDEEEEDEETAKLSSNLPNPRLAPNNLRSGCAAGKAPELRLFYRILPNLHKARNATATSPPRELPHTNVLAPPEPKSGSRASENRDMEV
jgi:hypothetical protein